MKFSSSHHGQCFLWESRQSATQWWHKTFWKKKWLSIWGFCGGWEVCDTGETSIVSITSGDKEEDQKLFKQTDQAHFQALKYFLGSEFLNKLWFSRFKVRGYKWLHSMSISLILRTLHDDFGLLNGDTNFKMKSTVSSNLYPPIYRSRHIQMENVCLLLLVEYSARTSSLPWRQFKQGSIGIHVHRPSCRTREYAVAEHFTF